MKCNHQFIKVIDRERLYKNSEEDGLPKLTGVRTVCVLCAEIREIMVDGTIHIYKNKGKIENNIETPREYVSKILKKDT